jgi:hypothetical protein
MEHHYAYVEEFDLLLPARGFWECNTGVQSWIEAKNAAAGNYLGHEKSGSNNQRARAKM